MTPLLDRYPVLIKMIPLVFAGWTLITLLLTLLPPDQISSEGLFSYSNLGHFGMFGGWTGLFGLYLMVYRGNTGMRLYPLIFLGIGFGAFIEFLQFLLPYERFPSLIDILFNTLGCVTAYLVLKYLQIRIRHYGTAMSGYERHA